MTIKAIVDEFVRSEYFANWQSEQIESGGYSRNADKRDRYSRCYDAAEDGGDGSTHAEVIEDMREAFKCWLRDKRNKRLPFTEYPYRVEQAAMDHFDELETWHENNGSLEQQIG